jgi:glyoxylase-like metal-dependent hydrolase (beta-lactamase superfamily II)
MRYTPPVQRLSENLFLHHDTCNVYVVRCGSEALLIDFGSGAVLNELPALGITRVAAIWLTHHHRDQGQGLPRAAARGIPIWVPHAEQDLFADVDAHWQARELYNSYNNRQDRFSLLESVPIAGTLTDYAVQACGGRHYTILPVPGHTAGSLSVLGEIDGRRVAFTGDLIAAPGKTWSLAALQWGYSDACGVAASITSLLDLRERAPDWLLPSHGELMAEPAAAMDLLVARLRELLDGRDEYPRLLAWRAEPFVALTRHVLWNRTSLAYSYVLLSDSHKALLIDYGYDFTTGLAGGADRAARRPWLYTLTALKRDYGVERIEVVVPTHYHDDHVAGCNLLRDVEGTQVWAAANFAHVLARPACYDLSCLWYDPIPVDRVLPLGVAIPWEEYELTLYPLPGHTQYAAAVAFEADGRRYLATGDQYQGPAGTGWNYVYHNGFAPGDYRAGAELYRRLAPEMILSGHWEPRPVAVGFADQLVERAAALERLHAELLLDPADHPAQAFDVRIEPYQSTIQSGVTLDLTVQVTNRAAQRMAPTIGLVLPSGWISTEQTCTMDLPGESSASACFHVRSSMDQRARRARIAVDITIGVRRLGQVAEALVTVLSSIP